MIRKSVVDQPLNKAFYTKWLQEVLLIPDGKAVLLEGVTLEEARTIRTAAWRFMKFHTKVEPDGNEGKFKIFIYR